MPRMKKFYARKFRKKRETRYTKLGAFSALVELSSMRRREIFCC
jgi:hypothetical protein